MKKYARDSIIGAVMALGVVMLLAVLPAGCQNGRLEQGGAYAPATTTVDSNGVATVTATAAPDLAFYQVDAAFDLAVSAVDFVFKFERENRAYLWGLDHNIKKTLDSIRPDAQDAKVKYALARDAYAKNPTPAGLNTLQAVLAKTQQIVSAVNAVLPLDVQAKVTKGK